MKSLLEYILEEQQENINEDSKIESLSKDLTELVQICIKNQERGKYPGGYRSFEDAKLHKSTKELVRKMYDEATKNKDIITIKWNYTNCDRLIGERNKSRMPKKNERPEYFIIAEKRPWDIGEVYHFYLVNYRRSRGFYVDINFREDGEKMYVRVTTRANLVGYTQEDKKAKATGVMIPISETAFKKLLELENDIPK